MSIKHGVLPLVVLLAACGGSGGGGDSGSDTSNVSNDIRGLWYYPVNAECTETIQFADDGTFRVESGEFWSQGSYAFTGTVPSGSAHSLLLTLTDWSNAVDCSGDYSELSGGSGEVFVKFPSSLKMDWYGTASATAAIGSYQRDNPLQLGQTQFSYVPGQTLTIELGGRYSGAQNARVAYGPEGLTVNDQGQLVWDLKTPMFSSSLTVDVGIESDDSLAVGEFSLTVVAADAAMPVTRGNLQFLQRREQSMFVADFDGDERNELLITGTNRLMSILTHTEQGYKQSWAYPFELDGVKDGDSLAVRVHDINGDGRTDIIALTSTGLYQITDLTQPARLLLSLGDFSAVDFAIADNDADGDMELLLLGAHGVQIRDLSSGELQTEFPVQWSTQSRLNYGNIDDDPQLELVLVNGTVYDSLDGSLQWQHTAEFGYYTLVADVDGDGRDEIIASPRGRSVQVFDAELKQLQQLVRDDGSFCQIAAANLDDDAASELLLGPCQWGEVQAYDIDAGSSELMWSVNHDGGGRNISVLATGDVDNDQQLELIWSSGRSEMAIADIQPVAAVLWDNSELARVERHLATGWGQIRPGVEAGVFLSARNQHTREGLSYVQMDSNGDLTQSPEIDNNWEDIEVGKLTDVNNDGFADLLFGSANYYDGYFAVHEVDSGQLLYGGVPVPQGDVDLIEVHDLNNDGNDDAIVVEGRELQFIDLFNQAELGRFVAPGFVKALALQTDDDGSTLVAMTYSDYSTSTTGIVLLRGSGGNYSQLSSHTNVSCRQMAFDGAELLCSHYQGISRYDKQLSLVRSTALRTAEFGWIGDINQLIPLENGNVVIAASDLVADGKASRIIELNEAHNKVIWRSPALMGTVLPESLHLIQRPQGRHRLLFGSDTAMFLTR
ncbi:FG-GAP repeat domain-containing protein [Ferrimonas kyonanensis]|uniref:FG-GAP repeat domain-containing protein n=1 Tax=Ferrimonas kyonanensis TaxID=364763 RepID=UPI0012EB3805|nr:VCBS repeat-containing protein [Ferrimonas kyonanensis]